MNLINDDTWLRLALDACGMGTFVWHIEEDRAEADRRTLELLGLPEDTPLSHGEALRTFVHPDDRARYAESVARATDAAGAGVLRDEIRILQPDGTERWMAVSGHTAFDPVDSGRSSAISHRRAVRMFGVVADITERKRWGANAALLSDLSHEFALLSSATEIKEMVGAKVSAYLKVPWFALFEIDAAAHPPRVHSIWGARDFPSDVTASDLVSGGIGPALFSGTVVVVRDVAAERHLRADAYAACNLQSFVMAPFIRNGALKFLLTIGDSRPRNWREDEISLCRELSTRVFPRLERAYAEEIVASDHRDTRLLQSLSAQLIQEQDARSLNETFVTAAASIMQSHCASLQLLYPERGARGELKLIVARGFTPEAERYWEWVRSDSGTSCGAALRAGTRVIVPDIEHCDFMKGTPDQAALLAAGIRASQSTPLVSRGGKMLGMITTHWERPHQPSERDFALLDILARQAADLMERTQAQELLRRSEKQLQEADRRKDEFLAVLSHELRNPLAPLRTGLELLRLDGDTPEAVESVRTMMEEQVAQMVRLIDDLLDVSRITSGKIRLQRQQTVLTGLLSAAVEANRAAIDAAGITLHIKLPDVPVVLDVDPTRVIQVLSNVLHNAVKFSAPRESITISAEAEQVGNATRIVISVADHGRGISADMLPRVFELFSQDEARTQSTDSGLGIGLALARTLTEMHGGTIDAHSDGPGLGSTFTMRLPVSTAASAHPAAPRRPAPPQINRRVVVIDDNKLSANAMQRLVRALGGECAVAYDGETGIEQVAAFRPDIVFVDIGMPGIDGYEACRRLRRRLGSSVFLVALTGWGQERDKQRAADAGFDLHLVKPPDPGVLEALLAGTAGRTNAHM